MKSHLKQTYSVAKWNCSMIMLKTKRNKKLQYFFPKDCNILSDITTRNKAPFNYRYYYFCKRRFHNSLVFSNVLLFFKKKNDFVILITAEPINFNILKNKQTNKQQHLTAETHRENVIIIGLTCLDSTFFPSQALDCLRDHLHSIQI